MNYKRIMLIIGIILCVSGTALYFVSGEETPVVDEPPVVKVECSSDLIKEMSYENSNSSVKINFFSCVEEVKNSNSSVKEYKDEDSKYSISFQVVDKNASDHYTEMYDYYTKEMKGAHSTKRKEVLTPAGDTFYAVDSRRIRNEAGTVDKEYYSISYSINENKTLAIELLSNEGAFDEDFILQVEQSVLVTTK